MLLPESDIAEVAAPWGEDPNLWVRGLAGLVELQDLRDIITETGIPNVLSNGKAAKIKSILSWLATQAAAGHPATS